MQIILLIKGGAYMFFSSKKKTAGKDTADTPLKKKSEKYAYDKEGAVLLYKAR